MSEKEFCYECGAGEEEIVVYEEKEVALTLVEQASKMKIRSLKDFEFAGEISASLKKAEKEISAYWKESVEAAKDAYDKNRGMRDADLKPVQNARKELDLICGQWKMEEDWKARTKQLELERKAAEKANREYEKLKAKAEEENDEKKKARLLEKAELVTEEPVFVTKKIEKTTTLAGGGTRTWIKDIEVEVDDIRTVCRAVADGHIPTTCVSFSGLKAWAKANGYTKNIYGVSIKEISRPSTRT